MMGPGTHLNGACRRLHCVPPPWIVAVGAWLAALVLGGGLAAAATFRTYDGSGNNLTPGRGSWGAAGQPLIRKSGPPGYADGVDDPARPGAPGPREISNAVMDHAGAAPNARELSAWVWAWGQFVDHDVALTPTQGPGGETLPIPIPSGDPVYPPGDAIPFTRSAYDPATGTDPANPRQQVNVISAWIDGSMVYGSDPARADWLRTKSGGRLKVTQHPQYGDLLPTQGTDPAAPHMALDGVLGPSTFVAGDERANEQVALTALHTLFVREHNRLADWIDTHYPGLPSDPAARDEAIYQRARKLVGAEVQAITYNEFLPALGVELPPYAGYDPSVDPSIATEFSTAGYRIGHTMVQSVLMRLEEDRGTIPQGNLSLAEAFFDPSRVTDEGGIEPLLRGLGYPSMEEIDTRIVDELRHLLFHNVVPPLVANGTDLAAVNIQRGRDHGLPDYNTVRASYGLPRLDPDDFGGITSDPAIRDALSMIYADVDEIDPWVGILAEDHVPGTSLGPLAHAILTDQFSRLRDGDRFWYETDPDLEEWAAPWDGLEGYEAFSWVQDLTLCDLILQNTEIGWMQPNVFLRSAGPAPIPEPATLALLGSGFAGLAGWRRRRKRRRDG
ncbi:MAG: hypothetical protein Kow0092_33250 [Deferrisomatales bacterium]